MHCFTENSNGRESVFVMNEIHCTQNDLAGYFNAHFSSALNLDSKSFNMLKAIINDKSNKILSSQ